MGVLLPYIWVTEESECMKKCNDVHRIPYVFIDVLPPIGVSKSMHKNL